MGHYCCCIPWKTHAAIIGCAQVVACVYATLLLSMMDDLSPSILWTGILINAIILVSAILFILGIFERRYEYMNPYLIIVILAIGVATISMCAVIFVSTAVAAVIFAGIILTCFLFYPIYLLYAEICDES